MSRTDSTPFSAVLTWAGIALLAYLLYRVVEPFLVPLGWACVLAVLLAPVQRRLTARYSAGRAAALCTTGATLILILPAVVLVTAFAREMVDLAQSLQATLAQGNTSTLLRGWDEVVRRVPFAARIDMDSLAPDLLRRAATTLMSQSGGIVTNIAVFFVDARCRPTWAGEVWAQGSYPRSATFSPDGSQLWVCLQRSHQICVFELGDEGVPRFGHQFIAMPGAACVVFR